MADRFEDAEIARRLLGYLARQAGCAELAYAEGPARISGGFDADIFGFRLRPEPPDLPGPLILRLARPAVDPARVRLEAAVQSGLAAAGYPAPRVFLREPDTKLLGGAFMVMARLAGRPLAHGVEGLGSGRGLGGLLRLVIGLPALLSRITEAWVEMQLRLHALPVEPLLAALQAEGIDPGLVTFRGQFERLRAMVERGGLAGLGPGMAWLDAHRPPDPTRPVICHGDFHPLNILAEDGRVTGVIDWTNVVIAAPEMDLGSTIANIMTAPFALPPLARAPVRLLLAAALRRYQRAYRRQRPLDDTAVRYFQVYRAMVQLAWAGQGFLAGRAAGGAFQSEAGVRNLLRHIQGLSGVTLRLHRTAAR